MSTYAGSTQTGMWPTAGDARLGSCSMSGRTRTAGLAMVADKAIATDVDAPTFHRHRRPWGTS